MPRIAAVDTDDDLLHLLDALFAEQGWQLLPLPRASSARAVIADEQPDVVLLDIWLDGGTSGWDLLRRLTMDPTTRTIPLIVWSGDARLLEIDDLFETIEGVLTGTAPTLQAE